MLLLAVGWLAQEPEMIFSNKSSRFTSPRSTNRPQTEAMTAAALVRQRGATNKERLQMLSGEDSSSKKFKFPLSLSHPVRLRSSCPALFSNFLRWFMSLTMMPALPTLISFNCFHLRIPANANNPIWSAFIAYRQPTVNVMTMKHANEP